MAEPQNRTLRLLQEFHSEVKSLGERIDKLEKKVDSGFEKINKRIDNLRQAMHGETVLGQYATAGIDDRREAIEKRPSALEKRRF